jgi:hypothetical protein
MERRIPKRLQEQVDRRVDNFLHYLKGYIMVAGGVEMSREHLLSMTLQEMFDSFCPNDISFGVRFLRMREEYLGGKWTDD